MPFISVEKTQLFSRRVPRALACGFMEQAMTTSEFRSQAKARATFRQVAS